MLRDVLHYFRSRQFRIRELVLLFLLLGFVVLAPAESVAVTCSTVGNCSSGSSKAVTVTNMAVGAAITSFQNNVEYMVEVMLDRLTRASNNDSQSAQAFNTAALNSIDAENVGATAPVVGAIRADIAQSLIPSASSCAAISRNRNLSMAMFSPARTAQYSTTQRATTDYAANLPTGPTGRGTLQSFQSVFSETLNGFCDPAVMAPPAGVSCTQVSDSSGRPMAWRFTQPQDAIFSRDSIPDASANPEHRAARLFSRMVIEPVPPDPIRGPVLIRGEGQGLFLLRQRDIAAINLARGVIDRMIDDRLWDGTAANPSLEQLRRQAWEDANLAYQDAMERAKQGEETNIHDLPILVLDSNRIYLQIYSNLERLAAIKATHLARTIRQQNSGNSSVSGRVIQRQ